MCLFKKKTSSISQQSIEAIVHKAVTKALSEMIAQQEERERKEAENQKEQERLTALKERVRIIVQKYREPDWVDFRREGISYNEVKELLALSFIRENYSGFILF